MGGEPSREDITAGWDENPGGKSVIVALLGDLGYPGGCGGVGAGGFESDGDGDTECWVEREGRGSLHATKSWGGVLFTFTGG